MSPFTGPPEIPEDAKFFYRFEDLDFSIGVGRQTLEVDSKPVRLRHGGVSLLYCIVEKETPKGHWISAMCGPWRMGSQRFVLKDSKKRYAYPTLEEAWESYRRRKTKQVRILEHQLKQAKDRLLIAENRNPEDYLDGQTEHS